MKTGTRWTTLMLRKVRERLPLCRTRADWLALAAELGVPYYGLKHKGWELGIVFRPPYTKEDDAYLLENYGKVSLEMAARWVGRTPGATRRRVQRLRRRLLRTT